jgi:hypothetical protein
VAALGHMPVPDDPTILNAEPTRGECSQHGVRVPFHGKPIVEDSK